MRQIEFYGLKVNGDIVEALAIGREPSPSSLYSCMAPDFHNASRESRKPDVEQFKAYGETIAMSSEILYRH